MKRNILSFALMLTLLVSTACGSAKSASENMALITANTWTLSTMDGQPVTTEQFPNGFPSATFTDALKVSGKGGCNSYSGSYNINEDSGISVSQVISTKMFCEGTRENDYFKALESANMVTVEKEKLVLFKDAREILVFTPAE